MTGKENAALRERLADQHRARMYADTPMTGTPSRQTERRVEFLANKRAFKRRLVK